MAVSWRSFVVCLPRRGHCYTITVFATRNMRANYESDIVIELLLVASAALVVVAGILLTYHMIISGQGKCMSHLCRTASKVKRTLQSCKPKGAPGFRRELEAALQAGTLAGEAWSLPEIERRRVRILEPLGEGAYGVVHKAFLFKEVVSSAVSLPQTVAVKVFRLPLRGAGIRDILAEVSVLGRVRNAHVVSLVGVITTEFPLCIVMELCTHGSLDGVLRRHPGLFNSARLLMAHDVSCGMEALHAQCIIHRDLAARNVLVDASFRCKVADFGHARRVDGTTEHSHAETDRFAIRWVAPEAVLTRRFSYSTDIWSFGVLMWEIWSHAVLPYHGIANDDILSHIQEGNVLARPQDCPKRVYNLMLSCWTEPTARPAFPVLHTSLAALLDDPGTALSPPASPPPRASTAMQELSQYSVPEGGTHWSRAHSALTVYLEEDSGPSSIFDESETPPRLDSSPQARSSRATPRASCSFMPGLQLSSSTLGGRQTPIIQPSPPSASRGGTAFFARASSTPSRGSASRASPRHLSPGDISTDHVGSPRRMTHISQLDDTRGLRNDTPPRLDSEAEASPRTLMPDGFRPRHMSERRPRPLQRLQRDARMMPSPLSQHAAAAQHPGDPSPPARPRATVDHVGIEELADTTLASEHLLSPVSFLPPSDDQVLLRESCA
uniref:Receptor-type protein tyrosine kinase n=1 Tax=Monosiga ovata TaxID=81526 RepID=B3XVW6_9EUKA|nr:receptor-type protein tyrosine kinase [Monosiga ovata]|eukprot:m.90926 g.90926  ORF g.90926 m.90926 type:complete len:667 (-) comp8481_c0_seq6:85-2085(-)